MSKITKQPTIKVLKVNDEVIVFNLAGTTVAEANRVRQRIIDDIPTMCIEFVKIKRNNASALVDEFLVHRLGMIPLRSNKIDTFFRSDVCPCTDYCDECYVELKLDVSSTTRQKNIFSKDLVSNNKNIVPIVGNILITKLDLDERIELTCYAAKGTGKDHTAHSAVSTVGFEYISEKDTPKGLLWSNTTGKDETFIPKKIPPKEIKFTLNLIGNVKPDLMMRYVVEFVKDATSV